MFDKKKRLLRKLADHLEFEQCYSLLNEMDNKYFEDSFLLEFSMLIFYYFGNERKIAGLYEYVSNSKSDGAYLQLIWKIIIDELENIKNRKEDIYNQIVIIKEFPLVRQVGKGCVPAAITMLIKYYASEKIAYQSVIREMNCDIRDEGTSVYEILKFFYKHQYKIFPFEADLSLIKKCLLEKFPVIIIGRMSSGDKGDEHACVVYGFDDEKRVLHINDSSKGRTIVPYKVLEHFINCTNMLCILAVPEQYEVNQTIINKVLQDSEYFNLIGVMYHEIEMYKKSEEMYRAGLAISPINADLHNNLAILLKENPKCKNAAIRHSKIAISLAPEIAEYQETYEQILKEKEEQK